MKKIILILIIICFIFSIDTSSIFKLLNTKQQEQIAEVGGEKIFYSDIEFMYDMRYAYKSIEPPSVKVLHLEYAEILYRRIEQILISQELARRNLEVSNERIKAFEALISQGYQSLEADEQMNFREIIEESGINYDFWLLQLKVRLEIETLQQEIARTITLESSEISEYVENRQNLPHTSNTYDFFLIKSKNKAKLSELIKMGDFEYNNAEKLELNFERAFFEAKNVPTMYFNLLKSMKDNSYSSIQTHEKEFYVLYLIKYTKKEEENALNVYSLAEKALIEEKTPQAFNEWLLNAFENTEIVIEKKFLPKNLPISASDKDYNEVLDNKSVLLPETLKKELEKEILKHEAKSSAS